LAETLRKSAQQIGESPAGSQQHTAGRRKPSRKSATYSRSAKAQ